ncbi:hypothetical protein B9Z19DRAFT_1131345 [Tuber borchii]|uniref:Uncharacterized protein n=1 Tax=Tuber borchii TaxID=42251 RepID=A0A2T6ZIW0_TUBBO|nr:hypothetical protein B9Z19DRAFT_1131345 [Tuber borchii]
MSWHKRNAPLGSESEISVECLISVLQLVRRNRENPESIAWAGQYNILPGITTNLSPLIMKAISGDLRIRSEYYKDKEKMVLSLRGLENLCFNIPETVRMFLFRPEEESRFDETILVKRTSAIKLGRNHIIPDSALHINCPAVPFMVIDVANENSASAVKHRLDAYIEAKGLIRFALILSTQYVDPQQKPAKTFFIGKVLISAYEITYSGAQTLLYKTEIWPRVPQEELIVDRIWEIHAHIPLKLFHDSICEFLGDGYGIITGTARKAARAIFHGLNFSHEEDDEEDEPEWPIKPKCTEINLGRRITVWRKPSSNPPYLAVEHLE